MASSSSSALSLLLLLPSLYAAAAAAAAAATADDIPPVQDILPIYGLPKGLLPNNVVNYSLSDGGRVVVELSAPCYVMFSELVYFDRIITGKLSYGAVTSSTGIQVRKFFLWITITSVVVSSDGNHVEFRAGVFSQKLPSSMFAEVPDCKKNPPLGGADCHGRRHGSRSATAAAAAAAVATA